MLEVLFHFLLRVISLNPWITFHYIWKKWNIVSIFGQFYASSWAFPKKHHSDKIVGARRTEINIVVTAMLSLLPFFSTIFNFLARHQSRDLANFSITAWWCKDSKQLTQSFVRYALRYAWKSNQEWIVRRLNGRVLKLLNEASSFDMCEMCVVFSFPLNIFYVRRKMAIHRKCDMNLSMCPRACKF